MNQCQSLSIYLDSEPAATSLSIPMSDQLRKELTTLAGAVPDLHALAFRGTAWLDSTLRVAGRGTASFIAQSPCLEVVYDNGILSLISDGRLSRSPATGLEALDMIDRLVQENGWTAVGVITYEAMIPFLQLAALHPSETPEIHFFLYDRLQEIDPQTSIVSAWSVEQSNRVPHARVRHGLSAARYRHQMERILSHIREGDIYQANLTHTFEVISELSPIQVYSTLRRLNPSPYGALINFGDYSVLSSSPERMFLREGKSVTTGPIKGTIARGETEGANRLQSTRLRDSEKDLAEHLMIVDLERNDLGRIARTGTVRVDELYRPEEYASLIHLTSDVSAELADGVSFADLCAAILPGGSITGAPKRSAVDILSRIEESPRGIYTGCIGYHSPERSDFNIAIRTITWQNGTYRVPAGGGIVADSRPEAEYDELMLKAGNLFRALGVDPGSARC